MHQFEYSYDPSEQPELVDLFTIKISNAEEFDEAWVLKQGELIMKIPCVDGVFYLIRKDFYTKKPSEK